MSDKKVVLIGAGKIGRGMSTFIFRNAGYHITYFCHSLKQAQAMREQGYFYKFQAQAGGRNRRDKDRRLRCIFYCGRV